MPRKAAIDNSQLFEALKSFKNIFNADGTLKTCSDPVWSEVIVHPLLMKKCIVDDSEVSSKLVLKPKQIHDYVQQNRHNLLKNLRFEFGFPSENKEELASDSSETSSISETSAILTDNDSPFSTEIFHSRKQSTYTLSIPFHEYLKMEPSLIFYKEGQCMKRRKVLKKGEWTNIITQNFYNEYLLPCAYSFKRNKVSVSENSQNFFFYAEGWCKECKAPILVTAERKPEFSEPLKLTIKAIDTRNIHHHLKFAVSGSRRSQISNELLHTAPSNWRREEARKKMKFGQSEPPILPSLAVCRTIRQEAKKKEFGLPEYKNVLHALQEMKYSSYYTGSLHTISYDSFFIHYWTKYQNHMYKNYANSNFCKVHIDATGSLVKKIKDDHRVSNHIFLYEIVVHISNKPVSICQMLSEAHDTATIEYWLNKWIKDVKKVPQESVTDFSLALIGASCRAFNECSIKSYLRSVSSILAGNIKEKPRCYLRIDVAHLIKFVSRWKCFDSKARLIRKFYIRCVALMVKCNTNKELEEIIINTLILCKSDTCGKKEDSDELTNSEKAKVFLGHCIEVGEADILPETSKIQTDSENTDFNFEISTTSPWVEEIINKSDLASTTVGNEPNPYYCPEFGKKLKNILSYAPLWTSVLKNFFHSPNERASSAIVECDFSILKQVILEHNKRPLRVDKFIACHLRALSGILNLTAASVTENTICSAKESENITEELEEEELWKGKNLKKTKEKDIVCEKNTIYTHKKFSYGKDAKKQNSKSNFYDLVPDNLKSGLKKTKSNYLAPYPNINFTLQSPLNKSEQLSIIKNGNLLEPIKFKQNSYNISNTCPFDALMHSFGIICIDNENYKNYAVHLNSDFFKCIKFYLENGVSSKLYQMRAEILSKIYPLKKNSVMEHLFNINAEDSMGNLISKLLQDAPSGVEVSVCQNTKCVNAKERNLVFWPIKLNISINDFYFEIIRAKSVVNKKCIPPCPLRRTIEIFPKEHLIIEPIFEYSFHFNLKNLPVYVTFEKDRYMLGAVIMHVQGGHFISYCRRKDNSWELYDDLKASVISAHPVKVLGKIEIIIYSKI